MFNKIHHSKNVQNTIKLTHPNDPVNMIELEPVEGCVNVMKEDKSSITEIDISADTINKDLIQPTDPVNIVELEPVEDCVNVIKEDISRIKKTDKSDIEDERETYMCENTEKVIKKISNVQNNAISYKTKGHSKKKIKKGVKNKTTNIIVGNCIANTNEPSFYTNNDKFLLHTKVFNKTVCFEIDSGATFSIISLDILLSLNKNFRQHCKKYKEQSELTGVSGALLKIDGVYAIPLEIPIIGRIYHKIYVIKDVQVNLLGREFFFQTGM